MSKMEWCAGWERCLHPIFSFTRNAILVVAFAFGLISVAGNVFAVEMNATCPDGSRTGSTEHCTVLPQSLGGISAGIPLYFEYNKRIKAAQDIAPLDDGLFGESVNLYNGDTVFNVTDIEIPGNGDLPLRLSRRLKVQLQPQGNMALYDTLLRGVGNWDVDVPYMAGTYESRTGWGTNPCSQGVTPGFTGLFALLEVWQGVEIHVPGAGDRSLLGGINHLPVPRQNADSFYSTSERDMFDCVPVPGGDGFRMTTAAGVRYYFTEKVVRTAATIRKRTFVWAPIDDAQQVVKMGRSRIYLLASKIEDRFGNTIQFTYNSSGYPTRIWANDGREILLTYTDGRLVSASSHGRTWQYQYVQNDDQYDLSAVVPPDGRPWQYSYSGNLKPMAHGAPEVEQSAFCDTEPLVLAAQYQLIATHPSGTVGTFTFINRRHYRSGVSYTACQMEGVPPDVVYNLAVPHFYDVMSLKFKTISGPGIDAPMTWTYDFGSDIQELWGTHGQPTTYPCTTCDTEKTVVVTWPDGSKRRHRFGILFWVNEGRHLGTETLDASGNVLRNETFEYLSESLASTQTFHEFFGMGYGMDNPVPTRVRPMVRHILTQQGRNFIREVPMNCGAATNTYCFDTYARPTKVVNSSTP